MKEERKSELLEKIRKKAKLGLTMINQNLDATKDNVVVIDGARVEREDLIKFKATLESVDGVNTIESLKELLKEDAIPLEMLMESTSWEELQRLIFDLHNDEENEDFKR